MRHHLNETQKFQTHSSTLRKKITTEWQMIRYLPLRSTNKTPGVSVSVCPTCVLVGHAEGTSASKCPSYDGRKKKLLKNNSFNFQYVFKDFDSYLFQKLVNKHKI